MLLDAVQFLLSGFTDNSGNPLNLGKVYTYEPGSTTPKSVYVDRLGAVAEQNPVILDANGRKQVYARGAYKFVIKTSADALLYTYDNIYFRQNYATTQAEISALNALGLEIVVESAITLTSNLTISAPLRMVKGGIITTAGFTLTINGPFSAGSHTTFVAASAQVVFGPNATLHVFPEWFGALGDGSTDDTTAVQVALNAATVARVPLRPQCKKSYRISTIAVPQYGQIISDNARRSYAVFKANSASAMFTLSNVPDTFITFKGLQFDGNGTAASCIKTEANTNFTVIEDCSFYNAVRFLDMQNGAVWVYVHRCEFTGVTGVTIYEIHLSSATTAVYIHESTFGGVCTANVLTDNSWTGDDLHIENCTFGSIVTDQVKMTRSAAAGGNVHFIIRGNRFDGGGVVSNINIGQYCIGTITDNSITGTCPESVILNGQYIHVMNNYFSQSTTVAIQLLGNSQDCRIYSQKWGALGGGVRITDIGTRNIIDNQQQATKGTTANRPNTIQVPISTQFIQYLDTDIDADGKLITWNGTVWVDATGAVV